ncbi:MAG TPA: DUF885 domain-containing protein [Candidatus Xenobia bacterium]|nr:DUF885 domain-containing protein [Candidatus Xenobia bacterium]
MKASPSDALAVLAKEFLYGSLALSPSSATSVGYHQHRDPKTGAVISLDEQLDDLSPAGIERQRQFYRDFRRRLRRYIRVSQLDAEARADYELIRDNLELSLLEIEQIESHKHKPQFYVETLGNAIFAPLVLEYAPPEKRLEHILARLEQVPAFLQGAKENLTTTAPIWLDTAIEENKGNIGLIQGAVKTLVPESGPLAERYRRVAPQAIAALEAFNTWMDAELRRRATADWRLGPRLYALKLRYALGTDLSPEAILRDAQRELTRTRREMLRRATPLHDQWFPAHDHKALAGAQEEDVIVREVLDRIAEEHVTRDQLMAEVKRNVQEIQSFLARAHVISLSGRENLQVIETPPFLRGIYGVAGFSSAPPLEPHLGAFYWVTPIPESWTDPQAESKLREYNNYMLRILTIHEALPGHYIQFEHAANIQPEWRRLLRSVFGNGPYVEGWAQYAQDMVLAAGYLDGDPRLALTNYKMLLRALANAIIDVGFHTGRMTDEEAMDLMLNRTFQERAEAEAKLRRAKLSSAQLPTYFVGWREWWRLRHDLERQPGKGFTLSGFHDRALAAGGVNLRSLRRLLLR